MQSYVSQTRCVRDIANSTWRSIFNDISGIEAASPQSFQLRVLLNPKQYRFVDKNNHFPQKDDLQKKKQKNVHRIFIVKKYY